MWCYHDQPCFSSSEVWVHLWNDVNAMAHSNNEDIRHFPSKIVVIQQRQIIEKCNDNWVACTMHRSTNDENHDGLLPLK